MYVVLVSFHVLIGVFLIAVVLLQTGKAGSIADVFGGGGSMAAFGARGAATVLSRVTTVAAILFMVTSLSLSLIKTHQKSIMQGVSPQQQHQAPKTPPAPPK